MRFGGSMRTKSEDHSAKSADVILQLGDSRIALKAEDLAGASVSATRGDTCEELVQRQLSHLVTPNDDTRAQGALQRMQEELSGSASTTSAGQHVYWGPDDFSQSFPRNAEQSFQSATSPETAPLQHITYHRSQESLSTRQQAPMSSVQDFARSGGRTNTFDPASGVVPGQEYSAEDMKRDEEIRRSKTVGAQSKQSKRPRKLDLANFFAQGKHSHSGSTLSPSQGSPSAATENADLPHLTTSSCTSFSAGGRRNKASSNAGETLTLRPLTAKKELEGDVFDPKTNVRRPPKGIQNWFDAYLSEDEDDEDLENNDEGVPVSFELPADEILPPAYDGPNRMHTNRSTDSNNTSCSGFSSDRKHRDGRQGKSSSKQDSVLSVSSFEVDQDARWTHSASHSQSSLMPSSPYSSTYLHSFNTRPHNMRSQSHESLYTSSRESTHSRMQSGVSVATSATTMSRDKPLPRPPGQNSDVAMSPISSSGSFGRGFHRMHNPSIGSTVPDSALYMEHPGDGQNDGGHVMAVTEEERQLLDLMRRKRAAMAQMSFSEGYQMALRQDLHQSHALPALSPTSLEHSRDARASDRRAPGHAVRSWTVSVPSASIADDETMRRQLSAIRKEDVDNALKMERFLSMQAQPVLTSMHPAEIAQMPVELPASMPNDERSTQHQRIPSLVHPGTPEDDDFSSTNPAKVKKFLANSTGLYAAPPYTASAGGSAGRRQSTLVGVMPSPVPEEEPLSTQAVSLSIDEEASPRPSIDHPVITMRDDPQYLPPEIRMMAEMLRSGSSDGSGTGSGSGTNMTDFSSTQGSSLRSSSLERRASAASFLSRQDSTKHLAHLRPAANTSPLGTLISASSSGEPSARGRAERHE